MHGLYRAPGGVVLRFHRQLSGDAGDRANANFVVLNSPYTTAWPRISKPMPTLATVAGAKAVTSVSTVPRF
jgi:hypothetical protein